MATIIPLAAGVLLVMIRELVVYIKR